MTHTLEQIGRRALSSPETLQATYDLARVTIERGILGDFVECGVFAGVQVAAMAKACMDLGVKDRKTHLFDSFEGIPLAGENDREFLEAGHPAGLSTCTVKQVEEHIAEWGIDPQLLVYHKGYFENTVKDSGIKQIALLRLDGDLYESTKVCLEHLYPLLSPGGWCIIDDFGLTGARKAVMEFLESAGGYPPAYWRKQ